MVSQGEKYTNEQNPTLKMPLNVQVAKSTHIM